MLSAKQKVIRAVFAEFLGTLFLVHLGCQAVISTVHEGCPSGVMLPALAFATIVATLIVIIGPTSGCHINPCVTIPLAIVRRVPPFEAFLYVIAQFGGAITGAATLYAITPLKMVEAANLGMNFVMEDVEWYQAVLNEMILTSVLVMVVLVVTEPNVENKNYQGFPPITIAYVLVAVITAGGVYTGASVNPARSLGPAVIMSKWEQQWVYAVGPLLGSLLGLSLYKLILQHGIVEYDKPMMLVKLAESDSEDDNKSRTRKKSRKELYASGKPFIVVGTEEDVKKSEDANDLVEDGDGSSNQEMDEYKKIRALPYDEGDTDIGSLVKADLETLNRSNVTTISETNA